MKLYELTYLLPVDLAEEKSRSVQERISNLISESQGTIEKIEDVAKRRLGEPINGQRLAHLVCLNFYFAPEKLNEFKKNLKTEEQILHYLILNKKPHRAEAPRRIRKIISETIEKPSSEGQIPLNKTERPKKVEIKEIEKKLDEILGE